MNTKYLLYTGSLIPLVFWINTIICGFVLGDYNHFSRLVSELGALGTNTQYVFTSGLILCSVLSLIFIVGLYRVCKVKKISVIPVLIILSYSISIGGAALFPLPLPLHGIFGMPSVLMVFSPLLSFILWKNNGQPVSIKLMSIVSFCIMSLGFLAFMPDVLSDYSGLKQRFFHLGWTIWFFYLSYGFSRLHEGGKRQIDMSV